LEPTARRGGVESSPDSPLEGTGFEPSVPRERLVLSFSFTPTFPLARVNRPDPIPKAYYDRAVKALGHVGITDVITLMGYSPAMILAFYDVPAGAPGMAR
jgi:hypothetical protein